MHRQRKKRGSSEGGPTEEPQRQQNFRDRGSLGTQRRGCGAEKKKKVSWWCRPEARPDEGRSSHQKKKDKKGKNSGSAATLTSQKRPPRQPEKPFFLYERGAADQKSQMCLLGKRVTIWNRERPPAGTKLGAPKCIPGEARGQMGKSPAARLRAEVALRKKKSGSKKCKKPVGGIVFGKSKKKIGKKLATKSFCPLPLNKN